MTTDNRFRKDGVRLVERAPDFLSLEPIALPDPKDVEPLSGDSTWLRYGTRRRWGYLSVLFLITMWGYFDLNVVSVVLEPIKKEFGASDTQLGLLSGPTFAVFYALAILPIARWADRGNRRTVICITLAIWSLMTTLCGLASSFGQLVVARFGVATAEPGAAAPAQSLVTDYFPPSRRATALGILSTGASSVGYAVGVGAGGYVAATHGWRAAFLVAGLPGVLLALLARLILPEPRLSAPRIMPAGQVRESTRTCMAHLLRKRSYVLIVVGLTVFSVFAFGTTLFLPAFMQRSLSATLEQVSLQWGLSISAAIFIGAVCGGMLADSLSKRDVRWLVWLPSIACLVGAPLYWLALAATELKEFIIEDCAAEADLAIGTAVVFAAIQAVAGRARRSTAVALIYFLMMLIGCGIGPVLSGTLSDTLSARFGIDSLRYALYFSVGFLIPATAAFGWAGRWMQGNLEE